MPDGHLTCSEQATSPERVPGLAPKPHSLWPGSRVLKIKLVPTAAQEPTEQTGGPRAGPGRTQRGRPRETTGLNSIRTDHATSVCMRLGQAERVPFRSVSLTDWLPKIGDCHSNVDKAR